MTITICIPREEVKIFDMEFDISKQKETTLQNSTITKRVLIVDDNKLCRLVAKTFQQNSGIEAELAGDGEKEWLQVVGKRLSLF